MCRSEAKRIGLENVRLTVEDDNAISGHIIESHGAVWLPKFIRKEGGFCHLFEIDLRTLP
jgi:predicted acetyltransferase